MEVVAKATANPAAVAASESSTHSVKSCCVRRARLAPRAERMDSSLARSAVRAIRRFATFVQAISRISATPAISTREAFFAGPASSSLSGTSLGGLLSVPVLFAGHNRSASATNCDCARSHVVPGLSRAMVVQPKFPPLIRRRLPDNGLVGIIESRRRYADHRERIAVDSDGRAERLRVTAIKRLPKSVADDCDGVAPARSPAVAVDILPRREAAPQHWLRAQQREKIPGSLRHAGPLAIHPLRPDWLPGFPQCGVREILALRAPIVKMRRTVERREECAAGSPVGRDRETAASGAAAHSPR